MPENVKEHLFRLWQNGAAPRYAMVLVRQRSGHRLTWGEVHALWVRFSWRY